MNKEELKANLLVAATIFGLIASRTKTKVDDKLVLLLQVIANSELLDTVYQVLDEWDGKNVDELIVGMKEKV
jgi:hypothetical protein